MLLQGYNNITMPYANEPKRREMASKYQKKYREKHKAEGRCTVGGCHEPSEPSFTVCLQHYEESKQRWASWKKKKQCGYDYGLHRGEICEKCDFIPERICQLTVDHIDGNRRNNDLSNLQTLCHNCHNLKTYYERGGK